MENVLQSSRPGSKLAEFIVEQQTMLEAVMVALNEIIAVRDLPILLSPLKSSRMRIDVIGPYHRTWLAVIKDNVIVKRHLGTVGSVKNCTSYGVAPLADPLVFEKVVDILMVELLRS